MAVIQQVFHISLGMARGGYMHLAKPRQRCVLPALLQFRPLHNGTAQLHLNNMIVLHPHLPANMTVLSLSFHSIVSGSLTKPDKAWHGNEAQ